MRGSAHPTQVRSGGHLDQLVVPWGCTPHVSDASGFRRATRDGKVTILTSFRAIGGDRKERVPEQNFGPMRKGTSPEEPYVKGSADQARSGGKADPPKDPRGKMDNWRGKVLGIPTPRRSDRSSVSPFGLWNTAQATGDVVLLADILLSSATKPCKADNAPAKKAGEGLQRERGISRTHSYFLCD